MAKKQSTSKNKKPFSVLRKGVLTAALGLGVIAGGAMLTGCTDDPAVKWHYGAENPTPELGKLGDFYFETDDGDVWVYGEDGWEVISNMHGAQGVSIVSIAYTSSEGLVDTYTITYSDNFTTTFTVTNGAQGIQGIQGVPGPTGRTPVITIQNDNWYIDGLDTGISAKGIKGDTGNGIASIDYTSTEGLVDTYTITYTNGDTSTFTVTNGAQGIQGEPGPSGHTPVITIENGNWVIDGVDTGRTAQGPKGDTGRTGFFVTDASQLAKALTVENTHLVLMNDIYVDAQIVATTNAVLDLNGHTIYCNKDVWSEANKTWSVISVQGGELTVTGNGTIQTRANDCYAFDIRGGGKLVIEDGHYVGNISAVYVFDGELEIKGGEFSIQQLSEFEDYRYIINCHDEHYRNGESTISISGGKFHGYNPAESISESSVNANSFVAEDRRVIVAESLADYDVYEVVDATAKVEDATQLAEALTVNNTNIVLMNDVYVDAQIVATANVALDLNGHTIYCNKDVWNQTNKAWSVISVQGGELTVTGNGTIQTRANDCYAFDIRGGGKLVIEDGHYVGNVTAVYVFDGELEIKGGEFSIQQLSEFDDYRYIINCHDEHYRNGESTISISGGKFHGYNPAESISESSVNANSFVAEGYEVVVAESLADYDVYEVVAQEQE